MTDAEPPGDGPPGGAPPPGPAPARRCEVCGTGLDADQTYCLECGTPTPVAPRLRRSHRAAALVAGAIALLAVAAGGLAFAVAQDDGGGGAGSSAAVVTPATTGSATAPVLPTTSTGTGPLPPATGGTIPSTTGGFPTVTGPSALPTAPPPATAPAPPPLPTVSGGSTTDGSPPASPATGRSDWPAGRTAYTVFLSSVRSESEARGTEADADAAGLEAGVLDSSDHANLRSGYWVVYTGIYDSADAAIARAVTLRGDYPDAYAREVQGS